MSNSDKRSNDPLVKFSHLAKADNICLLKDEKSRRITSEGDRQRGDLCKNRGFRPSKICQYSFQ